MASRKKKTVDPTFALVEELVASGRFDLGTPDRIEELMSMVNRALREKAERSAREEGRGGGGVLAGTVASMLAEGFTRDEVDEELTRRWGAPASDEDWTEALALLERERAGVFSTPLPTVLPLVFFDSIPILMAVPGRASLPPGAPVVDVDACPGVDSDDDPVGHAGAGRIPGRAVERRRLMISVAVLEDGSRRVLEARVAPRGAVSGGRRLPGSLWRSVFASLAERGLRRIVLAVTDGGEDVGGVLAEELPGSVEQAGVVPLAFISSGLCGRTGRGGSPVKRLLASEDPAGALEALESLEARHPAAGALWRAAWPRVEGFFAFPPGVRRMIHTTNLVDALMPAVAKCVARRGAFASEKEAECLAARALAVKSARWRCASKARAEVVRLVLERLDAGARES